MIVIDGLPIVAPEKIPNLLRALNNTLASDGFKLAVPGVDLKESDITMIIDKDYVDATGKNGYTSGTVLVRFPRVEQARKAMKALEGVKFGTKNTMRVNMFGDLQKLDEVPESFEAAQPAPFSEPADTWNWLCDRQVRRGGCKYRKYIFSPASKQCPSPIIFFTQLDT